MLWITIYAQEKTMELGVNMNALTKRMLPGIHSAIRNLKQYLSRFRTRHPGKLTADPYKPAFCR